MSFFYEYRKRLRLSQVEAAHHFKVSQSAWSAWEIGERAAPMSVLLEVCPEHAPPVVTSEHLRFFRRHLGLTIAKAAELCGCASSTWGGWEKRRLHPPAGLGFVLQNVLKNPTVRPSTPAQLRRFRKNFELTREQLAEQLHVRVSDLTLWELGMEAMPLDMG
ncbi:MAG: hypothetical protein RBR35_19675, partial [Salinivirgaceae bacterium]|nr:hypothetical protein [Salinivirgaceae bacterium]